MDKKLLKSFSIYSRRVMVESVKKRALDFGLGENKSKFENFISQEIKSRGPYRVEYINLIEDVAYNWFIRLVIIRFLEINDYTEKIVFIKSDRSITKRILEAGKNLEGILPSIFRNIPDYENSLLNISEELFRELSLVLNEKNFKIKNGGKLEIIGWIHQYYHSELKGEVDEKVKKNFKVEGKGIIYKTQLFTPNWIVKYMVENTLGRIYIESKSNFNKLEAEKLLEDLDLKYYILEAEQGSEVYKNYRKFHQNKSSLQLKDIKIIDPAMGTGHILIYVFDLLYKFYSLEGFKPSEAVLSILENNIYGLDIDEKSSNLSYFVLLMKAREYYPDIFSQKIKHNLSYFIDSKNIKEKNLPKDLMEILNSFREAKDLGSIIRLENKYNFDKLKLATNNQEILHILKLGKFLNNTYELVITNPPYLSSSNMGPILSQYCREKYPTSRRDLFAVFMEVADNLLAEDGYYAMINQHSWMFLLSYAKFREKLIENNNIVNLLHLGNRVFDIQDVGTLVQSVAFVMSKFKDKNYKGSYYRLLDEKTSKDKEKAFLLGKNVFFCEKNKFNLIKNKPLAYWISKNMSSIFLENKKIEELYEVKQGMSTSNNKRFVRNWREVDFKDIGFDYSSTELAKASGKIWFPYNKGGISRKWYGNNSEVVNYYDDGAEIKEYTSQLPQGTWVRVKSREYYFKEAISWIYITSMEDFGARFIPEGFIFDVSGSSIFLDKKYQNYILGLLCSKISIEFMKILNPTMNFQVRDIKNIPIIIREDYLDEINNLVGENIDLSKEDWDFFDRSWDFRLNIFIDKKFIGKNLKTSYENYKSYSTSKFLQVKKNEERLNQIYIDIYGLNKELENLVSPKNITLTKVFDTWEDVDVNIKGNLYIKTASYLVQDFLDYFLACLFGRYSLDLPGIVLTSFKIDLGNYEKFKPLEENILLIDESLYSKLEEFLIVLYGRDKLEDNLNFIAKILDFDLNKFNFEEEFLNYFKKDFFKFHLKKYDKLPIFWEFASRDRTLVFFSYAHRFKDGIDFKFLANYLERNLNNPNRAYLEKLRQLDFLNLNLNKGIKYNFNKLKNLVK